MKYRLPDGRQVQKKLGPAWTRRGRPTAGYFTKTLAQTWLDSTLAEARRGELVGMVRTGATFADAAAEWLRYVEHERACKPRTVEDYSMMVRVLNESFGDRRLEDFTPEGLERWKGAFAAKRKLSNRTLQKYLVVLHAVFQRAMRVHRLPRNPVATVERPRLARRAGIDVFSRDEVMALVSAAADEQDYRSYSSCHHRRSCVDRRSRIPAPRPVSRSATAPLASVSQRGFSRTHRHGIVERSRPPRRIGLQVGL